MFTARLPLAHVQGEAHNIFADERVDLVSITLPHVSCSLVSQTVTGTFCYGAAYKAYSRQPRMENPPLARNLQEP